MEYPRHEGDIRLEHPEIGEEFVCPDTYAPLEYELIPPAVDGAVCLWGQPTLVNGRWVVPAYYADKTEQQLRSEKLDENSEENRKITDFELRASFRLSDPQREDYEEWVKFSNDLQAFKHAWPRPNVMPMPPTPSKYDENGNLVTVDSSGSEPNVIG